MNKRKFATALLSLSLALFLSLWLAISPVSGAYAETYYSGEDWQVAFTSDGKMDSSFKSSDMDDVIYGLQPGDSAILSIDLRNDNASATDWYMTNEVLQSLEDTSRAAAGGAYAYRLSYTAASGEETVLFDSDTVGGEGTAGGEGLHEATNALSEYFFLDTLNRGQSGRVRLEVTLDGETQGNGYQDTLAKLQMNFAVEPNDEPVPSTPTPNDRPHTGDGGNPSNPVKTGEETNLPLIFCIMGVSGLLILLFAIFALRSRRRVQPDDELEDDGEGGREG